MKIIRNGVVCYHCVFTSHIMTKQSFTNFMNVFDNSIDKFLYVRINLKLFMVGGMTN